MSVCNSIQRKPEMIFSEKCKKEKYRKKNSQSDASELKERKSIVMMMLISHLNRPNFSPCVVSRNTELEIRLNVQSWSLSFEASVRVKSSMPNMPRFVRLGTKLTRSMKIAKRRKMMKLAQQMRQMKTKRIQIGLSQGAERKSFERSILIFAGNYVEEKIWLLN